ncbi:LacI family DNA-binding transcriptional regulator [Nocardia flavorosea]|uniref:LacI family transcriptional regulator n=1 Tax=Nocardia flavorosea TaxID=53429 RepID=A0A846YLI6_9NOCA|nr:LacI family DNA-binding transcriptional regulator [Nocardia flavorosea]NKY58362.1 LacI family transcriptional regulator [Nocardia flavorosea]
MTSRRRAGHNRGAGVTIYDIARAAGVSPSTVSRALHKPGRINATTAQHIRDTAQTLGYRINPLARALPTGRTRMLALILSDITNPVFFDLVRGAERVTARQGYTLVVAESQETAALELETAGRLLPVVDGLVLVASRLGDDQVQRLDEQRPLLMVNRAVPGVAGIVPDVLPGICAALDHLAALGHRALAFLSGPADSWMSGLRWDILLDEAPRRSMSIVEIGPGAPTTEGGRQSLRRVLASGVTAVVTYNDLMAIGLLQASKAADIAVPERLSIIGFDDIFGSDFTTPPITTIRTPLGTMGEEAVRRLIAEIDDEEPGGNETPLATAFVQRGSTAPSS